MSDQQRDWSPEQAMLAPDPNSHNRLLDRVAAEHLRAVAPHLAPCLSCQAGLCAEHGPTVTATTTTMGECSPDCEGGVPACGCQKPATATPTGATCQHCEDVGYVEGAQSPDGAVERLVCWCPAGQRRADTMGQLDLPVKRCATAPPQPEPTGIRAQLGRTFRYVPECETCRGGLRECPEHGIVRYGTPPAPEAAGEMSREAFKALLIDSLDDSAPVTNTPELRALLAHDAALRASREAERQSAERWAKAADASTRERDEARREGHVNELRAKSAEALLAAANARAENLATLRTATVKIITEALDGVPVVSAVTDPDTQAAREKAARLHARAEEAERELAAAVEHHAAARKTIDAILPNEWPDGVSCWQAAVDAFASERAARLKAEGERDEAERGRVAVAAAFRRVRERLGIVEDDEAPLDDTESAAIGAVDGLIDNRDLFHRRLAAAEAEVKRRDEYPHPCLICFGVRPASGKPCACNGTNNVYTAFDYLNAEAARLRLAYDDPTTDATDGGEALAVAALDAPAKGEWR